MSTANKPNETASDGQNNDGVGDERELSHGALTRQDLAMAIHSRIGSVSRREAKRLVDCVIEEMVSTLIAGESLKLHDFGSFLERDKHQRAGRNPRTGAPVPIDARRVIVFKAAPNMKATVNGEPLPGRKSKSGRRRAGRKNETMAARRKPGAATMSETLAE